jgi:mono/diheme cytochrome c family protein
VTQEAAWTVELDGPWNGGTLTTAGNLVFQGTSSGHFRAYDATSKDLLWDFDAQAAVLAGPVTYEIDGEQYVTVLAGYGSAFYLIAPVFLPEAGTAMNGRVYTFKLGGTAPRPRIDRPVLAEPRSPQITATATQVEAGAILYGRFCAVCHGMVAVSGGVTPDLRRSELLDDPARWAQVSVEGSLSHAGMPDLGPYLSPAETELIRAYVATQAALLSR